MNETSTVGKRVREMRQSAGMSQIELARRCGCSQPTLANIERGRTKDVQFWVLEGLAKHLGTTAQALVHGEQARTNLVDGSYKLPVEYETQVTISGLRIVIHQIRDGQAHTISLSPDRALELAGALEAIVDDFSGAYSALVDEEVYGGK